MELKGAKLAWARGEIARRTSVAQADDGDASLTTAEAAAYLGCTKGWLEKERLTGGGPDWFRLGIRLGVRYRRSALNQYIKGRTRIAERPRVAA